MRKLAAFLTAKRDGSRGIRKLGKALLGGAAAILLVFASAAPAAAQPFAYVTNGGSNNVSVIDTATNTVVATVAVGNLPFGVAITPDAALAYVVNVFTSNVSVIDTATNTVVATVAVGSSPFGVAITPDGALAYVANVDSANVSVIDTATNTVVATVLVGAGPRFVAITPDGAFVYVTNGNSNDVSVIDTATNAVVSTVPVGARPFGVAITPDGAFVYVTNQFSDTVSVIDTATNAVVATVAVVAGPAGVVAGPLFVAITPDGAFAYVTNGDADNVSVIDTATNTDVSGVAVGARPAGVAITPDGAFVYVANDASDDVSVIATASNTVVATVAVGSLPLGVAITPASPLPEAIAKTLENGPRVNSGGMLVDLAGLITGSNDAGPIDIGRSDSQFYEFILAVTNTGSDGELDGKIISDPIPDTYDLDPLCGDDPVAASTSCDAVGVGTFVDRNSDTFADGIINDTPAKCTVSTSTSEGGIKKDGAGLEPEFVTIVIDDLDSGETCGVRIFVRTDENPAEKTGLFEPIACRELDTGIFDTIPLNAGVKMFDPITGDRLLGPVGSLQLTPNNCP